MNPMDFVRVVNRTTEQIDATWDGRPIVVPPGYRVEDKKVVAAGVQPNHDPRMVGYLDVPDHTVEIVEAGASKGKIAVVGGKVPFVHLPAAAGQKVKWQCPQMGTMDPASSNEAEFRVAVLEFKDEPSYLPPTDAVELLDRSLMDDVAQEAVTMLTAQGKRGKRGRRNQAFMTDPNLKDVAFQTKVDYND